MKAKMRVFFCIAALCIPLCAEPKFPFPQNSTYLFGIKPSNATSDQVQSAYLTFMTYYEENGNLARIRWDDPTFTVSEGIGYGMLIMVYMDNAQNQTQAKFDKLWNYYQKWPDGSGLMHWKIKGFDNVDQSNAATDADLDVALALLLAYKQWGSEKYLNDAKDIIKKIWASEVNGNRYLKPGDSWDDRKNPSYFSFAAMQLFKDVDSGNEWSKVITNSYNLLKACRNSSTGLVPDWCSESGSPAGDYFYDATRTPWRTSWAYVWFGDADAKDISGKIAKWISQKTSGNAAGIVDGYTLDGAPTSKAKNNNPSFVGPFACAGMVDTACQAWCTEAFGGLASFTNVETYYNKCLQVLCMLLLTGNMPNLWDTLATQRFKVTVTVNPPGGGTTTLAPSNTEFIRGAQVRIQAAPNNDYSFTGWSGDISGTDTAKALTISKNMSITANFNRINPVRRGVNSGSKTPIKLAVRNRPGGVVITYYLPQTGEVSCAIFTPAGSKIAIVDFGKRSWGEHVVNIGPSTISWPNGTYYCHLSAKNGAIIRAFHLYK